MDAITGESLRRSVTITNPSGLHMRPLQAFVEVSSRFRSEVFLAKEGGERVSGKSLLNLLTLGADQGTVVHLEVAGPDCHDAMAALVEVLERTWAED